MRYYVTADVHGFYTQLHRALEAAGYYADPEPHRLIILGDLFDRGREARELQSFVLELMEEDGLILVRGNHEDLFEELLLADKGRPLPHHLSNGTYDTALQLTGVDRETAEEHPLLLVDAGRQTPYYRQIIPASVDWYETESAVFVHGWIPCERAPRGYRYDPEWRSADHWAWKNARWINGMDAAQSCMEPKTVFCGHWHCSYGHAVYERKGPELGPDADFSPYFGPGIVALDACTAYSGKINVLVVEDEPLAEE